MFIRKLKDVLSRWKIIDCSLLYKLTEFKLYGNIAWIELKDIGKKA